MLLEVQPPCQQGELEGGLSLCESASFCLFKLAMGDRFLSSAGAKGNCARPMKLPDPNPVLDKHHASWMIHGSRNVIQYWGWGLEKGSYGISRLQFCTP